VSIRRGDARVEQGACGWLTRAVVRVLFVCLGNICRSPTAEAVMRSLVTSAGLSDRIEICSAGTHAYHVGEGADPRSTIAARHRGYDLSKHRARRVEPADFDEFDYVLAMDHENLRHLTSMAADRPPGTPRACVSLLLDLLPSVKMTAVPDPYSRGDEGFELVLDLLESACGVLLERIRADDLAATTP
jgi:protein-tyrosine phosphatase